ncbi:MAG TPA: CTP synthase [Clostridiales bacterium]|nr:CTP synthase [Clostridiales bacterium]
MTKYVFVTGGVVSGLGKGIVAASLGRLLKARGLKIASQKFDPYMNVDPGTMNPVQHGEVYVTEDGAETDLDLGHYERFTGENLNKYSNLTSGKVFLKVIEKERRGEYLGETVQIIPHVTNETKKFIRKNAEVTGADVVITEIGGTIGDIESGHFLEAIRQFSMEVGRKNCVFIHVCLVPYVSGSDEYKSKPTQHSVKELQSLGISPDVIITRSDGDIGEDVRRKIALFCNVKPDCVISDLTVDCLYETPLMLHAGGLDKVVARELGIKGKPDLKSWKDLIKKIKSAKKEIVIALVGKYVKLHDSYLSVAEALYSAGYAVGAKTVIKWIEAEDVTEETAADIFSGADGIIVPGGFGARGIEGMIAAAAYARKTGTPYFGICLGMQTLCMEFARNACGLLGATSGEFDENAGHKIIDLMPDQSGITSKGGTMRLGAYPCEIKEGTVLSAAYGEKLIAERHRHRYEFNNDYREIVRKNGLVLSGISPDGRIVEAVEYGEKGFCVGVQFHPEFKSRPDKPHPLFKAFLKAAAKE